MVILDVQLWELDTQRLHQGLSETILVNTLTDVRELKKLTNQEKDTCDKDTTENDIPTSIKQLHNGKTPGTDGLTPTFINISG